MIMLAFPKGNWMSSSGFIGFAFWVKLAPRPFLEISICRVVSALALKVGNVSMLEFSIFSHWKLCGTLPGL